MLESAATSGATEQVAMGFWTSLVGTTFDEAARLIRRRLVSRIDSYVVSCDTIDYGRPDLRVGCAVVWSDCDVGTMQV